MKTWMKWTAVALAGAVAILAVVACQNEEGSATGDISTPRSVELSGQDNGQNVQLRPGDELSVTLESNASTGFSWKLVGKPDAAVLELVGSDYIAATTDLLGAPGQEVWRFKAVASGQTTLKLSYRRASGETSGRPFSISVEVASKS
jgi:inhibitor of cysteine peptidase